MREGGKGGVVEKRERIRRGVVGGVVRGIVVIGKDDQMCTTYRDTECSGNCDGKLCSLWKGRRKYNPPTLFSLSPPIPSVPSELPSKHAQEGWQTGSSPPVLTAHPPPPQHQ